MEQSETSTRPLLSAGGNEATKWTRRTSQIELLSVSGAPSNTAQNFNDTWKMKSNKSNTQPIKQSRTVLARIGLNWKRWWGKSWTAETLSLVLSILALAGLATTLLVLQSKPLPQWPQLVTINSIISLFSLIMRASVGVVLTEGIGQCKWNFYRKAKRLEHIERLDSASRGSWGSLNLLYHSRRTQIYYLAGIGAVVTIMSSLVGFFSQQLVQFQGCLQKDPDALVNISRTNSYSRIGGTIQPNVPVEYAPMAAAINVGLLQPIGDLTNLFSSGCSSGNCTFSDNYTESFSTLAFSHMCTDITSSIRIVNETQSPGDNSTTAYLAIDYGNNETVEWNRENGGEPVLRSWIPSTTTESVMVYFLFRSSSYTTDWRATSCSLFPSVNTYIASIADTILEEQVSKRVYLHSIDTQFQEPPVSDYNFSQTKFDWTHGMTTNYTIRNGKKVLCEGYDSPGSGLIEFMKHSDEVTYVNDTGYANPSAGWKWWYFPTDCVWLLSKLSYMTISQSLETVFDQQNLTMGRRLGVEGPVHLRVLFDEGNITFKSIDDQMQNLAASITSVIRTHGDPNYPSEPRKSKSYVAEGEMWVNTTCVYVRWAWITFPTVMIGLTSVFLLLVMFDNRGIETDRLWKSSFLAALFCEVEVDKQPVGKEEMNAIAKSTSVSLATTSKGLRLVA